MRDLDQKFAAKNGVKNYRDLIDNLCVDVEVLDGDKIQCGEMTFTVVELPGHTKCSVGFYLEENELLHCASFSFEETKINFANCLQMLKYIYNFDKIKK